MPFFRRNQRTDDAHAQARARHCEALFTRLAPLMDWEHISDGQSFCAAIAGLLGKSLQIEADHLTPDVQGQILIQHDNVRIIYTDTAPSVLREHILLHEGVHLWHALQAAPHGTSGDASTYFSALEPDFINPALLFLHQTGQQSEEELTTDLLADIIARHIEAYQAAAPGNDSIAFNHFMHELRGN